MPIKAVRRANDRSPRRRRSLTKFDSCLGAYTITITSPATNRDLSLWNLDVSMTLPPGWAYAPLSDDGTNFIYAGTYPRPEEHKLLPTEEEPNISADGKTLRWTYVTNGGKIDDTRARIFPREELKIVVYLKADGSNINCDLTPTDTHPTIPEFTQVVSVSYKDSCGNPLDSPKEAQVSIKPENAKLKLQLIPTPSTYFISNTDTEVYWFFALRIPATPRPPPISSLIWNLATATAASASIAAHRRRRRATTVCLAIGVIAELVPTRPRTGVSLATLTPRTGAT